MFDVEPHVRVFYQRVLRALVEDGIPFVVCGSYAMHHHTGLVRVTRDLDLGVRPVDVDRTLDALRSRGFPTKVAFAHWLAKVFDAEASLFVDVIWSSGNGISRVDEHFFEAATEGVLAILAREYPEVTPANLDAAVAEFRRLLETGLVARGAPLRLREGRP